MALHDDLLRTARLLATLNSPSAQSTQSSQADLRRAVSTAYYAVFHLLIAESLYLLLPWASSAMSARVGRSFGHKEMAGVCRAFARRLLTNELQDLLKETVSPDLEKVATLFCQLQQARHDADYNVSFVPVRTVALSRVAEAEEAFHRWSALRDTPEARVFLTALAFGSRWSK